MHWFYLFLAIVFEVAGTTSMKLSEGFTRLTPSILMGVFYILCFSFLTLSLKAIEVSTAYAIWSGLGIVLISVIGFFYFNETINATKIIAIALIMIGVVMLNLSDKPVAPEQPTEDISSIHENGN
ncbi:DMT family transporter [Chungangia koreensis]|uniref:DMT family transporter n=1 Tax=Chungangia koreensis TaxID=752657 RepID=A0ABV8X3F2_9LACT